MKALEGGERRFFEFCLHLRILGGRGRGGSGAKMRTQIEGEDEQMLRAIRASREGYPTTFFNRKGPCSHSAMKLEIMYIISLLHPFSDAKLYSSFRLGYFRKYRKRRRRKSLNPTVKPACRQKRAEGDERHMSSFSPLPSHSTGCPKCFKSLMGRQEVRKQKGKRK